MLRLIWPGASRIAATVVVAAAAIAFYACGSDSTGPAPRGFVAISPVFQADGAASVAGVSRIHVVFTRDDGVVALDTIVDVTLAQLAGVLVFDVPMQRANATTGEDLTLRFDLLTAGGQAVFRGGPISVHAAPDQAPVSVDVTASYVGAGGTAVRVEISPTTSTVLLGGSVDFTATAFDANNAPVSGALIVWSSLNPSVATVADPGVGRFVAGSSRGTTAVRATLFNGLSSEATLVVQPPATRMVLESGNAQTGAVGTALPQPLRVQVVAGDALGVSGVSVAFAISSGGGSLSAAQATTDASGFASVTYTSATTPGQATIQATAAGLIGSPASFTATAVPGPASQLVFTTQPANAFADATLASVVVEARDSFGNRATSYSGTVTVGVAGAPAGVVLQGTTAVAAAAGVATFSTLRVSTGANTAIQLQASGTGVATPSLSNAFNIAVAIATQIVLAESPAAVSYAFQQVRVVVEARSAGGVLATQHAGAIIVAITGGPPGGGFVGPSQALFVNGVATLETSFSTAGRYELIVISPGMPQVLAPQFDVFTTSLQLVSGDLQSGSALTALPAPLVVRAVSDLNQQPVANINVTWSVTAGGGTVSPVSPRTGSDGQASASWVLGAAGAQSARAQAGTLPSVDFTATISMFIELANRVFVHDLLRFTAR